MADRPPTFIAFVVTAFKRSVASWHAGEAWAAFAAYLSILILPVLVTGWVGQFLGDAVQRMIAFLIVGWLFVLFFIISPSRMWRDATVKQHELQDRLVPKCRILFEPGEPFVSFIPKARTHRHGEIPQTQQDFIAVETPARFFRFKMENLNPNSIAHGCLAYLRDVEIKDGESFRPLNFGDTLKLRWAAQEGEGFSPQNIPHLANKFVDVFSVDREHNEIQPKFSVSLMRHESLFRGAGDYRLTVFVASEDAGKAQAKLLLHWTNDWETASMELEA